MLFIDPEFCIDCEACIPECPVDAIYHENDVPKEWNAFISLNAEMSKICPSILERRSSHSSKSNRWHGLFDEEDK